MTTVNKPILIKTASCNYFACPKCNNEVGGFMRINGREDGPSTHKDNRCKKCNTIINWEDIEFSTIYNM